MKKQNRKYLLIWLALLWFLPACVTPKSYVKFAVKSGLHAAHDAGIFNRREFEIKTKFTGDTIFYYKGINKYLIEKNDSTYRIIIEPDFQNIEDTLIQFIDKVIRK